VKEAGMLLVFIEIREGKIKKSSLEALGEAGRRAAELGATVGAALVGPAEAGLDAELFARGAARVYRLENALLADYSAQGYALALKALVDALLPAAVFFAATAMGKDLAPRLAAKLGVAMASDCTKVGAAGGRLEFTRPVYAGKAFVTVVLKSTPQIATLRPNIFAPAAPRTGAAGETIVKAVDIPGGAIGGRVAEVLKESGEEIDVAEAEVVISGGRGLKGPENFAMLKDLSAIIPRSAVGASRSAVDSGWIGHSHQVGQTGKTVSPNLYIAVGISGAIQHLAGMSSSKVIVAVNKDPEAPIFKVADYGIVGDLFQVLPALKDELKKLYAE
jgi:electron transfer flavoprotein alpha subunit